MDSCHNHEGFARLPQKAYNIAQSHQDTKTHNYPCKDPYAEDNYNTILLQTNCMHHIHSWLDTYLHTTIEQRAIFKKISVGVPMSMCVQLGVSGRKGAGKTKHNVEWQGRAWG
jgi:hypothetical protein